MTSAPRLSAQESGTGTAPPPAQAPASDIESRIRALETELDALRAAEQARQEASELDELLELAEAAGPPPMPKPQVPANVLNPRISVVPDFVARAESIRGDRGVFPELFQTNNPYTLREVEVEFRAPVSPEAEAVANLAVGDNESAFEEAYIKFHSLPWDLQARVGRFRIDFGRANVVHGHDLPQVDRPIVHQLLFGEDGLSSAGISVSKIVYAGEAGTWLPTWSELVVEGINSANDEAPILGSGAVNESAFNTHWKNFWQVSPASDFEAGLSFLASGNNKNGSENTRLVGLDGTYRWKDLTPGSFASWLVQGEVIQSTVDGGSDGGVDALGGYLTLQRQIDPRWYAGVRFDRAESPTVQDANVWGLGPYVTFYANEFIRWRLQYQYLMADRDSDSATAQALSLQLTWVFGAHPPEPYWVNK